MKDYIARHGSYDRECQSPFSKWDFSSHAYSHKEIRREHIQGDVEWRQYQSPKERLKQAIATKLISNYESDLEKQFNEYAALWRQETAGLSTMIHITRNKYYNYITGMGPDVVPIILRDLQKDPDWWFVALNNITKADPVRPEHKGRLDKMANDWIDWGRKNNLI